jgi:hypothetical protein
MGIGDVETYRGGTITTVGAYDFRVDYADATGIARQFHMTNMGDAKAWLDAVRPTTATLTGLDGLSINAMRPLGNYYSWEVYKGGGVGYTDAGYVVEYRATDGVQQIFPVPYPTRTAAMAKLDDIYDVKPTISQSISTEVQSLATSLFSPITDAVDSVKRTATGVTSYDGGIGDVSSLWGSLKWYLVIIVVVVAAFILLAVRLNRPSITVGRMK